MVPNIVATSPAVKGTVDSHNRPMKIEKRAIIIGVLGRTKKSARTNALKLYKIDSRLRLL